MRVRGDLPPLFSEIGCVINVPYTLVHIYCQASPVLLGVPRFYFQDYTIGVARILSGSALFGQKS